MEATRCARCRGGLPLAALLLVLFLAAPASSQEEGAGYAGPPVLLRMASDSAVVGHYKFTVVEKQQMLFDIAADDPRRQLLESATVPKQTTTEIAATIVSTPRADDEDRRYIAYWLGYKVSGDDMKALTPIQWDSIFRKVGRRAVLTFSPRGHPKGVEVAGAARPVGQSLADALSALALPLPADSVTEGSGWQDDVVVSLAAPDGSRWGAAIRVNFRVRELRESSEGLYARIEFDGEPVGTSGSSRKVAGSYFGDSVFDVTHGRYDRMLALANLEIEWEDTSGLPPSRSLVEWQAKVARR